MSELLEAGSDDLVQAGQEEKEDVVGFSRQYISDLEAEHPELLQIYSRSNDFPGWQEWASEAD